MRYHLHFTYWILLTITILSSCFLFLVVATENAKYVAATITTPAAAVAAQPTAASIVTHEKPKLMEDVDVDETNLPQFVDNHNEKAKILPNYKKVKKLTALPLPPAATATTASYTKIAEENNLENNQLKEAPALKHNKQGNVQHQLIDDNTFDMLATHVESANEVIQKVPKIIEKNVLDDNVVKNIENEIEIEIEEQKLYKKTDEIADNINNDLPDIITEIPTVTVTELPIEFLDPTLMPLDTVIIDASKENAQEQENKTFKLIDLTNDGIKKDDQIVKINDSGGGVDLKDELQQLQETTIKTADDIPVNDNHTTAPTEPTTTITADINDTERQQQAEHQQDQLQQQQQQQQQQNATNNNLNLTAEEVPIPVFSEWAQKQMEAAEKQEALEQEQQVVNNSAQRRNQTYANGKPALHKIRSKNYASPDCGAKIIASNADATNTGAVLSSSKDEYMLSPCGNRIWFVVELCEAIQAQKVDLANFELFSSSPKNFTVAVSNRFPTRDWSNVGRFIAEDKRTVQSFDLHPHLFGKFVRVDIHTHYSKEHFCPVSLFRVFGTSEFEAFETENDPNDDLDDFDEEFAMEQARAKNSENNLFKSASDAVLSMVKKAAEVLVKPTAIKEKDRASIAMLCQTPAFGAFSCAECNQTLVERINNMLSCEIRSLVSLLHNTHLQKDLQQTRICQKDFGIETKFAIQQNDCSLLTLNTSFEVDAKSSYFLNLLPVDYVGALCQLYVEQQNLRKTQNITNSSNQVSVTNEQALNLTIDKKVRDNFQINMTHEKKLIAPEMPTMPNTDSRDKPLTSDTTPTTATPTVTTETTIKDTEEQIVRPPVVTEESLATTIAPTTTPNIADAEKSAPDVNIFNVPEIEKPELIATTTTTSEQLQIVNTEDNSSEQQPSVASTIASSITSTEANNVKIDEDPSSWESLDNLLISTVPTVATTATVPTAAGGAGTGAMAGHPPNTNGVNLQQKLPTGGPQSESVFIRLSNRIKALERNMSLSGQYLEELSRRYKKQVEELHQILTQQTQNVRTLEEQSRRHSAVEQIYAQRNTQLKDELEDLRLQIHACVVVIIFVGGFLFLVLIIGILFYRSIYRKTKSLLAGNAAALTSRHDINNSKTNAQKKVKRRKSFEDFSEQERLKSVLALNGSAGAAGNGEKERRHSEEAMLILKQCALDEHQRQRKLSVFYGSGDQLLDTKITNTKQSKRKGEKHSWPSTQQAQQQAQQHRLATEGAGQSLPRARLQIESAKAIKTKKKAQQQQQLQQQLYKRQESAPAAAQSIHECLNSSAPIDASNAISDYDESLLLDEDDLDNFLPNADLVYNEFMPEGPSGYQIVTDGAKHLLQQDHHQQNKPTAGNKKTRRLSSPAFFKSAFGKSLKIKPKQHTPPHESTSWEWYRLRKNDAQQNKSATKRATSTTTTNLSASTALDNTSLSEINFPTNSTQNSFRILEEAILMSGEATAIKKSTTATSGVAELTTNSKRKTGGLTVLNKTTTNNNNINSNSNSSGDGSVGGGSGGNGCVSSSSSCSISSASNSSRNRSCNGSCSNPSSTTSSCSNSTKNSKNRSFNKIFRKVF